VVTGIYRELIDQEPRKPTPQQKRDLEAIFNRGFTKGYLYGNLGGEAISYERPDNQGIQVGIVTDYDNASNVASILLSEDVRVGDGLEFETSSGKSGLYITELFMDGNPASEAFAGCTANMPLPFHPLANSRVGRTRDSVLHARTRATYSVTEQDGIVPIVNSAKISIDRQLLNKKLSSISSSLKSKQTHRSPRICAEVATLPALKEAVRANVSEIYFGGYPSQDLDDYKQALTNTKENHIPIAIALPRITLDKGNLKGKILDLKGAGADTFLVGDVGTLGLLRRMGLRAYLDSSFNIFNSLASKLLFNYAPRLTLSHELHISQIRHIAERAERELEYIVHGPITLMLSEHCPASDSLSTGNKITCRKLCSNNDFSLKDRKGFLFPIKCDESLNIHILNSVDLCLIDYIPELKASGVDVFRIQGRYYSPNIVGELVRCYRTALSVARGDSRERRVLSSLKKKIRGLSARGISKGKLFSGV
jgi:collagenase-like PrtC family protease